MIRLEVGLLILLMAAVVAVAVGQLLVRVAERATLLGAFNLYPASLIAGCLVTAGALLKCGPLTRAAGIAVLALASMTATATRHRSHALGAGGELRAHELTRRWFWQPAPSRRRGERVFLAAQGEVVRRTPWGADVPFVSVQAPGDRHIPRHATHPVRLPLGDGRHIFVVGATGSGKTTTARRVIAARVLAQQSSLVILDQKGDLEDVEQMRRLAARAGVPFVLFDSQDPATDRWQPLWGSPEMVAARATEAIKSSEPYYHDVLRKHLDVVCRVLHAADRWPPSVPFLIDACEPVNYPAVLELANQLSADHAGVTRRAKRHQRWVASRRGGEDLAGAVLRIETALALSTSRVITPRPTPAGERVAVRLADALAQRAVVMWRTHADTMPDAAAALTAVALADLHAAVEQQPVRPWTLLLDEFGAVINTNGERALAILQRARSHHGQAVVITQSVADIEALTETPGLLDSLTDNFAAVVAHRQTSPNSRDWLSRLMGTRELWQSTNQTDLHGARASGRGSVRRVHEFRVAPDSFAQLTQGEAVIYSPEGLQAHQVNVAPVHLQSAAPRQINRTADRDPMEITVHPTDTLDATPATSQETTRDAADHF